MCTYFGLFGGDMMVALGEATRVAHRIADCVSGGGGGGGGEDRGRQDDVPMQRNERRLQATCHDGVVKVQARV